MRWAKRQRLNFIRDTLLLYGRINRADLTERFEISVPQASIDIRDARAEWPSLMAYDATAKCYVAIGSP
jgi:hypothetical protein